MLNIVPFVSVDSMMRLIQHIGIERFIIDLSTEIESNFCRWEQFEKVSRLASHGRAGVIELMPTSDSIHYAFKYVNGHPLNGRTGRQTVAAFGVLADVPSGYPLLICEMTILTALRTAATSALAARHLAPSDARTMAIIGNGAQSEFQALAFKALLGVNRLRLYDTDPEATAKCVRNLDGLGFEIHVAYDVADAVESAEIITTVTADKRRAGVLGENLVGKGVHINAVGGDCPGKTELQPGILQRARIFVEHTPQTRVEGEIQQLPADYPVEELWRVISGAVPGRANNQEITVFDSVGFAIEDFSALRYVHEMTRVLGFREGLDLIADPDDTKDLLGMLRRAVFAGTAIV